MNEKLFEKAKKYFPGGVSSPVRALKPYPFFAEKGEGAYLYDVEGNSYIDYCLAYGPLVLGHSNPEMIDAVRNQLEKGSMYGAPTKLETEYAKMIVKHIPNVEMIRIVNTGTEATMNAIRVARGFTSRNKILKFEGAYHGAHDYVLVKAGSGATTHSVPDSLGVPKDTTKNTLVIEFNNVEALQEVLEKEDVACVITEPVIGNAGFIPPKKGFLKEMEKICRENDTLLIFDEVITGFRLSMGGAQEYFGVNADIVCLGKIAGGGFPIGIFGGRREIMENISPQGKVYNAGTFNGNPISVTAGLKTLEILEREKVLEHLNKMGERMRKGLDFENHTVQGIGGMFQIYFNSGKVYTYREAKKASAKEFLKFQQRLLRKGVFLPPSQYECNFISLAHTKEIIDETLEKIHSVIT
ncbi:MAG: glutamate-1-semialdehyde 2,1-aminomutase [Candidatus Methanofastidiosia archaeon]